VAGAVITVRGLRKAYGDVEAVRGIDLEVDHGEIFAFLGPNGAGKTTTVEILEGYRPRDAGEVLVLGVHPEAATAAWRSRVGVVLQSSQVEPALTVRETVALYAGYYRRARPVEDTIELVGLTEARDRRAGRLSGGQQRRLDVALALIGDPELLFLDEPTTGFDPAARRAAWEVIANLRALGKTVFLTTHYLEEAEVLADRVAIIKDGRIVATGRPADLVRHDRTEVRFGLPDGVDGSQLPDRLRDRLLRRGGRFELRTGQPVADLAALCSWAVDRGVDLTDLEVARPSLEDVYLELTAP
jgi:ABC-2 type transport system ATP-binding protein